MPKTKEELEALKKEKDSLMSKINELTDDELKQISGGTYNESVYYENESDVSYIYEIGEEVEVYSGWLFGTVRCRIVDRHIVWFETHNTGGPGIYALNVRGYRDEYKVQELEDHWYFYLNNEWLPRDDIQK